MRVRPDRARDLMENLVNEVMSETVTWDRNLTATFKQAVDKIDQVIAPD